VSIVALLLVEQCTKRLEGFLGGGQGVHRVSLGEVQNEHLLSSVGQECRNVEFYEVLNHESDFSVLHMMANAHFIPHLSVFLPLKRLRDVSNSI
jgi:hypothetical protein